MKFIQYTTKEHPEDIRLGYLEDECVIDIGLREQGMPHTMLQFLQNDYYLERLKELKWKRPCCMKNLKDVLLKAPITGMDKVICVCLNYKDHCELHKIPIPPVPVIFSKFASVVIGPSDPLLIRTDITCKVDWEVELCIVMGKKASCVKQCRAYEYIFGFTVANDVTARDWQRERNGGQFLLGKSMDTFCPVGPWIVTLDELGSVDNLEIKCSLNGVNKQRSNTNQLIYKVPAIIERLTQLITLLPGDIILTGSPSGLGVYSNPPEFMKPGDILRSEIEKIGVLETRVERYIKPDDFPWQNYKIDKNCLY
ncbi:fumarylacetoacetate hydrolase domain-containing protein 2-like [Pectinophora gossypiella]|uniref:fumarylacetoacetate hydrolase domain-containing protein 2-like n=1 Tax=Pectinophora gossypiella TaxID=13191 RepID=UPI00214E25E8|nr:fumarylacetoacetate hydrolase domain-containing protein 2-like [Pectinophora gossypiella]